jgi:hypothetical protein
MAKTKIPGEYLADGGITVAKMAANSVDSDQYVDGSIDLIHMSVNSIDSDQYVDGSIDTIHIADGAITSAKLDTNIAVGGTLTVTGDITGTLATAAQTNITSVGTLTGLTITAATPSIQMTDSDNNADAYIQATDGNVRFYADDSAEAADSIVTFNIDGSERMRINSSGNVGIGESNPSDTLELGGGNIVNPNSTGSEITSATFGIGQNIHLEERQVNGAFSDRTDLAIVTNTGFGLGESEKIRIEASGNVGIGTTTPTTALTIRKAIASAAYGQQASMIEFKSYFTGYDTETVKSAIYSGVSDQGTLNTEGGYMAFHVNNDGAMGEKLRIEKSGNVGIGTSLPEAKLDVKSTLAITEASAANSNSELTFYSKFSDSQRGYVLLRCESLASGSSDLAFRTRNNFVEAERLRIQAGGGISFNGDTAAANALDDYEEGTFTATIGSNGTHPTITQGNTISCTYTKIGNVCTVHGYSGTRDITAVGTGSPSISGLPFTATNYAQPVLSYCNMFPDSVSGYVEVNQSFFYPIKNGTTTGDAYTTGAKLVMFSMTYRVN